MAEEIVTMNQIELPTGVTIDEEKYKAEQAERYLKAASNFLQRSFEYAKAVELAEEVNLIDLSDDEDEENHAAKLKRLESIRANPALDPTHPKVIDLATFRMIILADETYELFFSNTLRSSIHADEHINVNNKNKVLRSMFDGILADGKRVAEQVRRRVDSVATRNSITSAESTPTAAASSATTKEEKYDDLDDFTSDHQSEHEELLQSSWFEIDDANETHSAMQERPFEPLSANPSDKKSNLIEFEA